MSFSIFLRMMLKGWPLFLLSFIAVAVMMKVLSQRTYIGQPSYRMTVMSRYADKVTNEYLLNGDNLAPTHLWDKNAPYQITQIYAYITSVDVIYRAGMDCGFDMSYAQKNKLRYVDVYNDLPYRLRFLDMNDMDQVKLIADWTQKGVRLTSPSGTFQSNPIDEKKFGEVSIALGDTAQTSIGRVVCLPQAANTCYPRTKLDLTQTVYVSKQSAVDVKTLFDKEMSLETESLGEDIPAYTFHVRIGGPVRLVTELLEGMAAQGEKYVHEMLQSDLMEERQLIEQSLRALSQKSAEGVISSEAAAKERNLLNMKLTRNISNSEALSVEHFLTVVDAPSSRHAKDGFNYLLFVLLTLGIIVPMLIIYYCWLKRGCIYEMSQLSALWHKKFVGSFKMGKSEKSLSLLDEQLDLLRTSLSDVDRLVIASPSYTQEVQLFVQRLVKNTRESGRSVVWHDLLPQGSTVHDGATPFYYRPGYLGSQAFDKDVQKLIGSIPQNGLLILTVAPEKVPFFLPKYATDLLVPVTAFRSRMKQIHHMEREMSRVADLDSVQIRTLWLHR